MGRGACWIEKKIVVTEYTRMDRNHQRGREVHKTAQPSRLKRQPKKKSLWVAFANYPKMSNATYITRNPGLRTSSSVCGARWQGS